MTENISGTNQSTDISTTEIEVRLNYIWIESKKAI